MHKCRIFVVIVLTMLAFSRSARAAEPTSVPSPLTWPAAYAMSWDLTCGKQIIDMTFRTDGRNSRTDNTSGKFTTSTIINRDHQQMIMIMNNSVHIFPFSEFKDGMPSSVEAIIPSGATWYPLGPDEIDGKDMTKYSVTYSDHNTPRTITTWVSKDDSILRKIVMADGTIKTLTSYKPGPQDPAIFEIPKD